MKKGLRPLFSAQYDLADRVTYTDNAGSVDMPQVQFYSYYDYEGNRVWLGDSQGGSVWYAWNNQRLQSMALFTENYKSAQVGFGYDSVGRLARRWQPHPVGPKHGLQRKAGTPILGSLSAEGPAAGRNLKQDQGLESGWRKRVNNRYGLNLESTKLGSVYFQDSKEGCMDGHGLLENINLSGVDFNSKGDSVTFHLVGMVPPYQNSRFECHNIYSFELHRSPDLAIPYYIGELVWRELGDAEKKAALEKVDYPFFDQKGDRLTLKGKIFSVHVEGGICGDILAEKVMFTEGQ